MLALDPDADLRARTAAWLLLSMVLAGTALRALALDSGLWYDEIRTVVDSVRSPLSIIVTHFPGNNDHLLYSVLAHLSVAVFGEHSWSLRLPAVVFGVAAIPMLYLLGRQVTSRLEAAAAAGLMAVSYHAVWFAQNARGYTLLLFATLLATHALLLGHRRDSRRMYLLYAVVAALGAYTHLTMVLVVLAHAAVILVALIREHRGDWQRWHNPVLGFGLAGVLTLCLYAPVLGDVQSFFGQRSGTASVATAGWALREAVSQLSLGLGAGVVVLAALLVGLVGCWSYFRQAPLALALFVIPGPVLLAITLLLGRPVFPRFFFFLAGLALLIGVRGVTVCTGWIVAWGVPLSAGLAQRAALTLTVAAMVAASALALPYSYRVPKQDYQGALRYVETRAGADDAIAIAGGGAAYPYQNYFRKPWPRLAAATELAELVGRHRSVWLLHTFSVYVEATQPDLAEYMRSVCRVARTFPGTVAGGSIVVSECPGR